MNLRLEKSELKNHVHVSGEFEEYKEQNFYEASIYHEVAKENEPGEGDRVTSSLELKYQHDKRGQGNLPKFEVSGKRILSKSDQPVVLDDDFVLSDEDLVSLSRQNYSYGELEFTGYFDKKV